MDIKNLRNCLIRFLLCVDELEDCEKGDLNDWEQHYDGLKEELLKVHEDLRNKNMELKKENFKLKTFVSKIQNTFEVQKR